jgi:protein-tyrosine phosphatase
MVELVQRLDQALAAGKNVAVHCRQGIGRSSVVVASLLVAAGETPDEAFRRIEEARGRPVPDTAEQREWVAGSQAGSLRPPSHPAGEDAGGPRGKIGFDEGSVPGYNRPHNPSRRLF